MRMLTRFAVNLASAAVAFLVAKWLIPDFHLEWEGFFVAVAVFTLCQTVLGPFVFNMARQYAAALLGGIGLVSTLLSLIIASLLPGGLRIEGVGTWFVAAVLIWFITALGGWILLALLGRRAKRKADEEQEQELLGRLEKRARAEGGAGAGPDDPKT